MAYAIEQVRDGVPASNSYTDIRERRWLGFLAALALTSGATTNVGIADQDTLTVAYPESMPISNQGIVIESIEHSELLLREFERIAKYLALSDPKFDADTLRALYSDPEELYI